ncbi:hypothetical protein J2S74_002832 [Evansella vedderi]|uniref:DUF4190 domain-containing protein n=1 Tax=Evansella vedderi TaxID=38282 RepID=A0ABT9ZW37_9BACI|nr:hypothetical protein [Evansella vedderi]MDQ0255450.1 hypothetical protein [Evansella vedderi]
MNRNTEKHNYDLMILDNLFDSAVKELGPKKLIQNLCATASSVVGVIGFLLSTFPIFGWFSFPLWITAIILGAIGRKSKVAGFFGWVGMGLGVFTIAYKVLFWIFIDVFLRIIM